MLCSRRKATPKIWKQAAVVIPQRECVTNGFEKSIAAGDHAANLQRFARFVFDLPISYWKSHALKKRVFSKVTPRAMINFDTVRVYSFPLEYTYNNANLPLFLYEWDWTDCTPQEALEEIRKWYFDEEYIDDESFINYVERVPLNDKHPTFSSISIISAKWKTRPGFTERQWVGSICVDTASRTVVDRSSIHPAVKEETPRSFWSAFEWIFPPFLTTPIRAESLVAIRLEDPQPGKTGCRLRQLAWNEMKGFPDILGRSSTWIFDEYFIGVFRQFNKMSEYHQQPPKVNPERAL